MTAPTVNIVVSDVALAAGETSLVTFTFSEAVLAFDNMDIAVANGTLSAVASADGGITWTATLTPTADLTATTNVIAVDLNGVTDSVGTPGVGTTDSNNYAIDTVRPTATIAVTDTALAAGETSAVTITFSEAVTGFTNADLTIANGTLSAVASADGGITWTATFTPTANLTDTTNVITLANTGVADTAGNAGTGTTNSNNYAIDSARPTATIAVADTALLTGETSAVTITFSEAVTGFTNADLTIANGTLSAVASADGGITWTATLTPTANLTDTSNVITLANSGVADVAGNAGTGTRDSNNYEIDTTREPDLLPPPPPPISMPGTSGTDSITGNTPGNLIEASAGNDTVNGGEGMDSLQGNVGADRLSGGGGGDQLLGGKDDDFVHGNAGNDTCFGDDGDDIVRGGQGNDLVNGGNGNDFVSGDKGDDTMTGGAGADVFHTFGEAGLDLVIDFDAAEGDRVNLDPGAQYTVAQVGGDTVITLTGGGQMVLQGVQLSALADGWIVGA